MATNNKSCGCAAPRPVNSCDCDHPSSLLGLMLYMPCEGLNPGASLIISDRVYKDLMAWATADAENKYIIASDGSGRYEAISTWNNPTGEMGGIIIKNAKTGDVNYLKISEEESGHRFIWMLDAPTGGGDCDCGTLSDPEIEDICQIN